MIIIYIYARLKAAADAIETCKNERRLLKTYYSEPAVTIVDATGGPFQVSQTALQWRYSPDGIPTFFATSPHVLR